MSKNNITSGMLPANKAIYEQALITGKWIKHKKEWYTTSQFARQLGGWEINPAHVQLADPMDILNQGRMVVEKMITDGKPTNVILDALNRLNAFTDRVRLYHPVNVFEYK